MIQRFILGLLVALISITTQAQGSWTAWVYSTDGSVVRVSAQGAIIDAYTLPLNPAFNAYGPYQSVKAVIPELIVRCLSGGYQASFPPDDQLDTGSADRPGGIDTRSGRIPSGRSARLRRRPGRRSD